ncbi:MAG TPA: hypothetical protein VEX41_09300, partial [Candidatus Eisenbacteria bacterium]|nr:hypothetical protein [Candidatus Eisenbacteria bacterium]
MAFPAGPGAASEQDELDAQDPFAPGARETGYRIGVRFESRPSRRPRLAATLTGAALVIAIGLGIVGPGLQGTNVQRIDEPKPSVERAAIPTRLPALTVADAGAPDVAFPVLSGGLRWLDPRTGSMSGQSTVWGGSGWIFAGTDGTALCVCYDQPWSEDGTVQRVTIVRYDAAGHETSRDVAAELTSPSRSWDAILRDVAVAPDRGALYMAAAIRDSDGWAVSLDTIDLDRLADVDLKFSSLDLGRVAVPATGAILSEPTVRVSPDGRRIRVSVQYAPRRSIDPEAPWTEQVWLVDLQADGGPAVRQLADRATADPGRCDGEAWASNTDYVVLCRQTVGDARAPIARVEDVDGSRLEHQVGDAMGRDDLDWLVDSTAGIVYRWSRFSHALARLDVRTGDVLSRTLAGSADEIDAVQPAGAPWPNESGDRRAVWAQLLPATALGHPRFVGSRDGSILYAIGMRSTAGELLSGPLPASTGVWVFEARTLALLARWPAVA